LFGGDKPTKALHGDWTVWLSSPIRSGAMVDQMFACHWSGQRGRSRVLERVASDFNFL